MLFTTTSFDLFCSLIQDAVEKGLLFTAGQETDDQGGEYFIKYRN